MLRCRPRPPDGAAACGPGPASARAIPCVPPTPRPCKVRAAAHRAGQNPDQAPLVGVEGLAIQNAEVQAVLLDPAVAIRLGTAGIVTVPAPNRRFPRQHGTTGATAPIAGHASRMLPNRPRFRLTTETTQQERFRDAPNRPSRNPRAGGTLPSATPTMGVGRTASARLRAASAHAGNGDEDKGHCLTHPHPSVRGHKPAAGNAWDHPRRRRTRERP